MAAEDDEKGAVILTGDGPSFLQNRGRDCSAMTMPAEIFVYRARAVRVVDGDTCDLIVDLGFRMTTTQRFRLLGVDTPELHSKDTYERERAVAAMQALTSMLAQGTGDWPLLIRTQKSDSFGRWLAEIWVENNSLHVNDALLAGGYAVPFKK
jgi:micrococcal nuclease